MTHLHAELKKWFGFPSFRPGQEEIITAILNKRMVVTVQPTGAGKSLCYQLPGLLSSTFAIIVSPLISLMKDQVDKLNAEGLVAGVINSTMTYQEAEGILQAVGNGKIKLLYAAPERLANLTFSERMKQYKPEYLFVDEAHCISEWGHNFRPAYRKIREFIEFTGIKNISAFTATATPEVIEDIVQQLHLKEPFISVRGFERDNISLSVVQGSTKKSKTLELARQAKGSMIVYAASRKNAEEVHEFLSLNGINSRCYHAGIDLILRARAQEEFAMGKADIIVATNAFGMGIDKKDIRTVIHYNMPGSVENYYQEFGRAGRDGKPSKAILLYDKQDEAIHRYFISTSYPTKEAILGIYNALCDYGKVALGEHYDKEIVINYDYLRAVLRMPDMTKAIVHSALRYLEDARVMQLVPELTKRYSVMFQVPAQTLKNFIKQTKDHVKKMLVLQLLREYGGQAFDRRAFVSPAELALHLNLSELQIEKCLKELSQSGILEFSSPSSGTDAAHMLAPRLKAEFIRIDYDKLNRAFLHAHKKVDQMISYVFSSECRFGYILQYFGQKTENYRCGKCDKCQEGIRLGDETEKYMEEIIILSLAAQEQGLPPTKLIGLLSGKTKAANLLQAQGFSALKHYSPAEIIRVVESLEHRHLLKYDAFTKKNLQVTNLAVEQLAAKGLLNAKPQHTDYEENLELLHLLREARKNAAEKFNQSVFLICPDETMKEITLRKPDTKHALLSLQGFNERMYNKFGREILEIINTRRRKGSSGEENEGKRGELDEMLHGTLELVRKGCTVKEIAKLTKNTEPVIAMQIETILQYDPDIDISRLIPPELPEKLKSKVAAGIKDMKELKKIAGEPYSYPEIRIAAAKLRFSVSASSAGAKVL